MSTKLKSRKKNIVEGKGTIETREAEDLKSAAGNTKSLLQSILSLFGKKNKK